MREIKYIVIHCTGTPKETKRKSIENHWKNELGWKKPGYHCMIDQFGVNHILSDVEHIVNGAKGFNSNAIHIAYIGGINEIWENACTLTMKQSRALQSLLKSLKIRYPNAEIVGHRDLSFDRNKDGKITPDEWEKVCPCFDVDRFLTAYNI